MTTFTGPLAVVSGGDARTAVGTAMRVASDGSAQFHNNVIVSGRMRHGPFGNTYGDQGITQTVVLNMQALTARASIMNFPIGSTLVYISFGKLEDALTTAQADIALTIGTSADPSRFIALSGGISDAGIGAASNSWAWPGTIGNGAPTAAAIMNNVQSAADTHWFAKVSVVSGATTSKRALFTTEYIRSQ